MSAGPISPRTVATVDLGAIRGNVRRLAQAAPTAQVMAVVKADGYGHGLLQAAQAALSGGADWLGVATTGEASALRAAGIRAPLLVLLLSAGDAVEAVLREDIDLPVGGQSSLAAVAAAARCAGRTARVHLEVDSGMGRGGATR